MLCESSRSLACRLLGLRCKVSLASDHDVFGMSTNLDAHLAALAIPRPIGWIVPNDVAPVDVVENARIKFVGLFWLFQIVGPSAGAFGQTRQRQMQAVPDFRGAHQR